jgi:hypothetical protein
VVVVINLRAEISDQCWNARHAKNEMALSAVIDLGAAYVDCISRSPEVHGKKRMSSIRTSAT